MSTEALPAPLPPGWADRMSSLAGPLIRRRWPLLATLGLIVIGMLASTWGATLAGRPDWGLPDDLWRTLAAAQRLLHLDMGGLYTAPTELISFPGAAVILIPVAAIADAAGLSLQLAGPQNPHPAVWLLAGPYEISPGDILYPPFTLLLFVPFTILPAVLWWLLPAAVVGYSLLRLRPRPIVWPFLALCLAWPPTLVKVVTGNPVIWAVGALALGVLYAWPSVLVLIKPSLFPFAFFGANRRAWWLALGALIVLSLPFGFLWIDWIHSILNSQGGGIAYSIQEIPMLAFPVIAWAGRPKTRGAIDSPG